MSKDCIHPTAQLGFAHTEHAQDYQQARPSYPKDITTWLQQHLKLTQQSVILDLAAGTGKFTARLHPLTKNITAVEPVSAMREVFKQQYPKIHIIDALSHHIPLPSHQFDVIFCAQAFHWFSNIETLREMKRLLKPQGDLILIWNDKDTSQPWVKALSEHLKPFEKDAPRFYTHEWQQVFVQQHLFHAVATHQFNYVHTGTVQQVVTQRLLSSSFVKTWPSSAQKQLKYDLEHIVHQMQGKSNTDDIAFPYLTHIYHFRAID
ncbi:class I SAM-dependent methyltransferase [Acinetobacter sp. B5B]|uniref:class I SAM-dependent methyltransferase n=1 Tax=Acinetobacter baretiae TaxID=2605383 RepID=UPI0018C2DE81|nr:class I SAM-dependent methyltransferase [Acinetobacter baretiae]MBF7682847.1 class I SAM-dependent methyltransferase [Acinetobacter baretiae]MBF7685469.1 class I SAM-dependent methyltransferase [Acinetobacter baretiae]